jgi:AraC family transcriptional regulator
MLLRFEVLTEKKLVGKCIATSFADNKTAQLWRSFMPHRNEITTALGPMLYSVEIYPAGYFEQFDPTTQFEKWAAMEVKDFAGIPENMTSLFIPAGLYAVFIHRGPASRAAATYEYIFRTWLPAADFVLDQRPHFAVMNEKYRHEDAASEEEVRIPVRPRI